nr:hypothetical protein [Tanacetum cinerariifolium]
MTLNSDSYSIIPTKTAVDAKVAIQEMAEYSQQWHNGTSKIRSTKTSDGLAAIQAQINNLRREIKKVNEKVYVAQVGCEQCKGPHYTKDCPLKEEDRTVKYPKGIAKNVLVGIGNCVFPVDFMILDMPGDVKVPLILSRPVLSTTHAKIDMFKRKIISKVGDEKIIFKSMKPASSLIKRVYMFALRKHMELYLEVRLTGETLVLNRSLDPLYRDYIELNDIIAPLELRRDQVDDLMPTIEEGKIDIIKTRNKENLDKYPSFFDFDQNIHIDYAYNLRFSYMIGFEHINANFFELFSINMMSREVYNSIMKEKVEYEGKNVVGAFMNVPIFIRKFSIVTHFVVVENMDEYRDQDMGDIIFREPFCKASCVEARRFDGLINIP